MNQEYISLFQSELPSLTADAVMANKLAFLFCRKTKRAMRNNHDQFDFFTQRMPSEEVVEQVQK
ncbi:MAG: hypothetical protein C4516_07070 [Oxalobacter sp.]|nr:MAG: hypothetical protein C4516_07070 [Oxalobacter sp.]